MPTINVSALSVGAIAVDAFAPDFTNPACTVFTTGSSTSWGRLAGNKYIAANVKTGFTVQTTATYTDVEVTTYARKGEIFLRYSEDDDRAMRVSWNEDADTIGLHPLYNVSLPANYAAEGTAIFPSGWGWDMTTFAGYVRNAAGGRTWTFGLEGIEFFIKMTGVEVVREKFNQYHLRAGKVFLKAIDVPAGGYGFDNITVTALTPVSLYSDADNKIFDPRDYGCKDIATTGTIGAASTSLTVADATGYEIGDPIIVEVGGEAGLGLRGTVGVGGSWPTMSYATEAARSADLTQVDGRWAWAEDTTRTAWYDAAAFLWKRSDNAPTDYYEALVVPYALVTTITNIVGNVFTLADASTAAATNANVYYNCIEGLRFFVNINDAWDDFRTLTIPAGNFAVVGTLQLDDMPCEIYGQGIDDTRIFSPDGAEECNITFINISRSTHCSLHDLEITGNFGDDGYHLQDYVADPNINRDGPGWLSVSGADFYQNGSCYNVRSGDHSAQCFHAQFVQNMAFYNCEAFDTDGLRNYRSWGCQIADSTAATSGSISFTDCSYTCPKLRNIWEAFRSRGVHFIRCTSQNGTMAMNSSGDFLFEDCYVTMTEDCEVTYTSAYGETVRQPSSLGSPPFNINTNLGVTSHVAYGGVIRNCGAIVEGLATPLPQGHGFRAMITINNSNPNITVMADPPWTQRECDAPLLQGYFSAPPYDAALEGFGPCAVNTTGLNTVVDGIRVASGAVGSLKNVAVGGTSFYPIVRNCVMDNAVAGTSTGTLVTANNITNAQFEAICGAGSPTTLRAMNFTHVVRRTKVVGY